VIARLWPASLFGRIVLILFLGLAAAQAMTFAFVLMERSIAMRGTMVSYLASDVASSVAMLERLPPAERAAWLPRLERRGYRFALEADAEGPAGMSPLAESVQREVAQALRREVRVADGPGGSLRVRIGLGDGTPVTVHVAGPRLRLSPWIVGVLAAQLALLLVLCWQAVRWATRPLQQLADAADALQPAAPSLPLPQDGPREVARASAAFNAMQARIRAHLDERMHILAAVSHDLQTPITRLRLRAELMDDPALRDKLHADLAEMQALVEEGIAYARSAQAVRESPVDLDLQSFVQSRVHDYTDAGQPVRLLACEAGVLRTRPQALRRLLSNLIDNAIKFAGEAEVALDRMEDGAMALRVLDRGPGIPDDQLQAVLQPFVRIETSRSRETGGTGLGLAIAQELARAIGAELVLAPRPGGGLEARVLLGAAAGLQRPALG
jgi:signal transduction histidine kinase